MLVLRFAAAGCARPPARNDNSQGEYYLTDVPTWIQSQGGKIGIQGTTGEFEGLGVNTQADLDLVNRLLVEEKA